MADKREHTPENTKNAPAVPENIQNGRIGSLSVPAPALYALETLQRAGFEAALVGGCVRDALMNRAPGDFDIASSASPEEAMEAFRGEKIVPTGLKHGTILLVREGMPIEITTFREDGEYADMRRPESVRFTRSLSKDVLRRDFTMNALAWERGAGVIDTVGGRKDIQERRIRTVGEAEKRFSEDALRILRALRFSAQLGFTIDPEAKAAIRALYPNLAKISRERVWQEFGKLIAGPDAGKVLREYEDVLRSILPCEKAISPQQWEISANRLEAVGRETRESNQKEKSPLLLAAFLMPVGEQAAGDALRALRSDEKCVRETALRIRLAREINETTPYALRRMAGENGFEAARDALRARFAFEDDTRNRALTSLYEIESKGLPCAINDLTVNGTALKEIGVKGKTVGAILRALLDEVRADKTPNEKEALIKRAAEMDTEQ